ncbi:hypothetical protein ACMFMG_011703 [Clarireedia jacksonii]
MEAAIVPTLAQMKRAKRFCIGPTSQRISDGHILILDMILGQISMVLDTLPTIFPNAPSDDALVPQNLVDGTLNDEIDNEENPYTMKGMGTKNALPTPKPGCTDIKPWDSLKQLDFVDFEGVKILKDAMVQVLLGKRRSRSGVCDGHQRRPVKSSLFQIHVGLQQERCSK